MEFRRIDMPSLWQVLSRTFFWSYERGTWQYDLAVVLILIFVLATPRNWFQDQPQVGLPAAPGQVQLVKDDGRHEIYRVHARVLAPPQQTPAQKTHPPTHPPTSLPVFRSRPLPSPN